jgi:hypothetical protein
MAGKKNLKKSLEDELKKMLEAIGEPSEGRMKLIALGIKMCALNAKLEESEYGEFFRPDDEPGSTAGDASARTKPAARSRANGGADA